MRILTYCFVLASVSLLGLQGAEVTGEWKGEMAGGHPVTMNLKSEDGRVTGRVLFGERPLPVTSGKLQGDKLTFSIEIPPAPGRQDDGFTMFFESVALREGEIQFSVRREKPEIKQEFVVKRSVRQ